MTRNTVLYPVPLKRLMITRAPRIVRSLPREV